MIFSLYNKQFLKAKSSEMKKQIWLTISREICAHDAMENVVIYPLIAQYMKDGDKLSSESLKEHSQIARLLQEMMHMSVDSDSFMHAAEDVMRLFKEHIEKEESILIPFMRENMNEKQLRLLHAAINDAKTIAPHSPLPSDEWFSGPMTTSFELLKDSLIHPE
ncbi:hypothetical protein D3C80_1613120 [compost metagenome]